MFGRVASVRIGGKSAGQVGMQQLEDPLRSVEIAQRMLAEVAQAGSWRQRVPGKVLVARERSTCPP